MTLTRLLPTQNPSGLPVADERRIYAGLFARNADGTVRPGILPGQPGSLISGRAEMAYDIAPFVAVTSRSTTGAELVANDAVTRVATTAAPGANSRIDVLWVRPMFPLFGDAASDPVLGVTQGAAAAIPTKPSIPAGALELGTAVITSSTTQTSTAVFASTHPYTATAGGVVLFRNATEMTGWAAAEGSLARDLTSGDLYRRVSNSWVSQEAGRRLLIPSSVTGGATLLPSGRIQLTAGDSVTVNGVFSSKYRSYEIIADWQVAGGVNGAQFELCAAGVPSTSGYYQQSMLAAGNSIAGSYATGGSTFAAVPYAGNGHFIDFTLIGPALARDTYLDMRSHVPTAGIGQSTGYHQPFTSYDGFRLHLSTVGTGRAFSGGELAVYGLA